MSKLVYIPCAAIVLVAAGAWGLSYRGQCGAVMEFTNGFELLLYMAEGRVKLTWGQDESEAPPTRIRLRYGMGARGPMLLPRTFWERVGFKRSDSHGQVMVPHWLFVALPALPPLLGGILEARRRRRRRRQGRCVRCGYDLRGVAERCPECGSRTDAKVAGTSQ